MDFYFDNKKYYTIVVNPENSIGDLKTMVANWMIAKGDDDHINIRVVFSNGVELSQVVFTDDMYNNVNLTQYKDVLTGGKIYIISSAYLENKKHYDKYIPHDKLLSPAVRDGQIEYIERYFKGRGHYLFKRIPVRNAYHLAIEIGNIPLVEIFENSGELARSNDKDTELKMATTYNHLDLVKYFLDKGVTMKGIQSSIDLAKSRGYNDVTNHLQTVLNDLRKQGY